MPSAPSMTYRVEISRRAERDLRRLYRTIHAEHSGDARAWFHEPERMIGSLDEMPERGGIVPEDGRLRELLHGRPPRAYRIICAVDDRQRVVRIVHIRHGARDRLRDPG